MAARIQLEIVTPDGVQLSQEVDEFTAPSVEGEFGVLPGHRPLLAGLKTGIVRYIEGGTTKAVAVGPGFAKVAGDQASLLTDQFVAKDDVDAVHARKDLKEAEEGLSELTPDSPASEKNSLIAKARWAAVRLELYGDPPPPTIVLDHEMRLLGHEDYSETAVQGAAAEEASEQAEESN